jgi:hypothetical protein
VYSEQKAEHFIKRAIESLDGIAQNEARAALIKTARYISDKADGFLGHYMVKD